MCNMGKDSMVITSSDFDNNTNQIRFLTITFLYFLFIYFAIRSFK